MNAKVQQIRDAWWDRRATESTETRDAFLLDPQRHGLRWPTEAQAFAFSAACVGAGFHFSEEAAAEFDSLAQVWQSDLGPMYRDCVSTAESDPVAVVRWRTAVTRAMATREESPVWDPLDCMTVKYDAAVSEYVDRLCGFVRRHFNRPVDIKRGSEHIHPSQESPAVHVLWVAAAFATPGLSLEALDDARLAQTQGAVYEPHPQGYAERRLHSALSKAWRHHHWRMLHDRTLITWGRAWYRARVHPGTIDDGIDEVLQCLTPGTFLNRIQDYDDAMQYQRVQSPLRMEKVG